MLKKNYLINIKPRISNFSTKKNGSTKSGRSLFDIKRIAI
jgi:hypothetical protein